MDASSLPHLLGGALDLSKVGPFSIEIYGTIYLFHGYQKGRTSITILKCKVKIILVRYFCESNRRVIRYDDVIRAQPALTSLINVSCEKLGNRTD